MDVRMPAMDGIEATRRLKKLRPSVEIVALTANEDQAIVREMLVAGASGFVLKDSDGEDILNAVMQAALGGAVLSPGVTSTVIDELTEALERERRRTQELEAAQAALVERAARRHELVSRLSHELRTPVTVILGVAQTLARKTAAPEQERASCSSGSSSARAVSRGSSSGSSSRSTRACRTRRRRERGRRTSPGRVTSESVVARTALPRTCRSTPGRAGGSSTSCSTTRFASRARDAPCRSA